MEVRVLFANFIRSIIVEVISAVETIFGAAAAATGSGFFSSRAAKSLERTRGDARDRDGVFPRLEVEALRGVVLFVVDSLGVVGSDSSLAAAPRLDGVCRLVGV